MSKQFFVFTIIVLILAGIGYWLAWPAFAAVSATQRDFTAWQEKLAETKNLKEKFNLLAQKYENEAEAMDRVMMAVPAQKDIPALLVQLEALTSQNGLILNSIVLKSEADQVANRMSLTKKTTDGASATGVKTSNVGLFLSGTPSSLRSFLRATEENLRMMDIEKITFDSSDVGAALVNFSLSLNIYHLK